MSHLFGKPGMLGRENSTKFSNVCFGDCTCEFVTDCEFPLCADPMLGASDAPEFAVAVIFNLSVQKQVSVMALFKRKLHQSDVRSRF
ncbi:MAG: hypothetical protein AAGE80_17660 [Pseudomonadota bacterium]